MPIDTDMIRYTAIAEWPVGIEPTLEDYVSVLYVDESAYTDNYVRVLPNGYYVAVDPATAQIYGHTPTGAIAASVNVDSLPRVAQILALEGLATALAAYPAS